MHRSLFPLALVAAALAAPVPRAAAQTPYRCVLHVGSTAPTVDSCTAITPPAPAPTPLPAPTPTPAPAPAPAPAPVALACGRTNYVRVVKVASAAELRAALAAARPGDAIVMADGTYSGSAGEIRVRNIAGTASQRISLCGSQNAILDGGNTSSTDGLNVIGAPYWTFSGFTITDGLGGLRLNASSNDSIVGLTVHGTGQEAIHVNGASRNVVIARNRIYDTGKRVAEYGEGIYVGSANGAWVSGKPDSTDFVVIDGNAIGPDVRAEHIDAKEGTHGGIIRNNTFTGTGMVESQGTGESGWPNSWVILQGVGYSVTNNTGTKPLVAGFRVVTHGTVETGTGNTFASNTFDVGGAEYGFLIQAGALTSTNVVACSNKVTSASKALANVACKP